MNLKIQTPCLLFFFLILVGQLNAQSSKELTFETTSSNPAPATMSSENPVSYRFTVIESAAGLDTHEARSPLTGVETTKEDCGTIRLRNKIIPLTNPVYEVLEYFETKGYFRFLPEAKPYTKGYIVSILVKLAEMENLPQKDKAVIHSYLSDIMKDTNSLAIYRQSSKNTFALFGFNADASVRSGVGKNGSVSASFIGEPFVSGDLGENVTFTGGMGLAVEQLRPDMIYQSYTRDKKVVFPYQSEGYSYLPYQFNFNTMWDHVLATAKDEGKPVREGLTAGMIYHTEFNGTWLNNAVQLSFNNQQRAWGFDQENLVLSSTARRFPGLELKIYPATWLRYSFLTGSLFSYFSKADNYKKDIYGYDVGQVQKNFSYHLLEFIPARWLQLSFGGGSIWSKRFELAYMTPFVLPHFTQIDVGDHDNTSLNFELATQLPGFGKGWINVFVDELSLIKSGPLLKLPRNRYAWQIGWKTTLLSSILPGTTSILKYTRLTPFVYTHYPDSVFNNFGTRPNDMTYSHDGFNLGFYLPPNSSELTWKLVNIAIPDWVLTLNNRFIIHGTNDLASSNINQIYGDINRWQIGDAEKYPYLNFTKDGIYDYTIQSEFKFDWKIRRVGLLNYLRLQGSAGYSKTWWKSNQSGVIAPGCRSLMTGSIGVVVEI